MLQFGAMATVSVAGGTQSGDARMIRAWGDRSGRPPREEDPRRGSSTGPRVSRTIGTMPPEGDDDRPESAESYLVTMAGHITPDAVARANFPTVRRGYDPQQVRALLDKISAELRDARDREAALRTEVESLRGKLESALRPDEAQLAAVLGEETARVLLAAREAAAEIRAKAEESVARRLREAQDDATRLKSEAENVLAQRTQEADEQANRIKAAAEQEAEERRQAAAAAVTDAELERDRILLEAVEQSQEVIEEARARGQELVDEATLVRTRLLEDLSRKRKAARVQLERLQAGRDRLLESYDIVRRTLESATNELKGSLVAAKHSADAAARRVEAEPPASVEQLEAEVEAARAAGLPLVEPEADPAVDDEQFRDLPEGEMVPIEPSAPFEEVTVVAGTSEPEDAAAAIVVVEAVEVVDDVVVVVDEPAEEPADVDVDDLFARIRAARADEVAKAREVLGDGGTSEPEPESESDVAPAEAPTADTEADTEAGVPTDADSDSADEVAPGAPAPDDQALLERRDGIVDRSEQTTTRRLKRVLADEQNDVLDRLRRNAKATLDDLLPPPKEHTARYANAARDDLMAVAKQGASFFGATGTPGAVDDIADQLGEALAAPLRDRVAASLREAAGDDEALADGVRAAYRDWKTHRLGMQARDSVFAAFNRGLYDATEEGTTCRWLIDDGGSPCPDAEDNSLAGLVAKGEPYPTGHCFPPAHPGCRCLLVPSAQ